MPGQEANSENLGKCFRKNFNRSFLLYLMLPQSGTSNKYHIIYFCGEISMLFG